MQFRRWVPVCAAALISLGLLSGCAGTARGQKTSVYKHDEAVEIVDNSRSQADALVVIRYPAIIHEDAERPYFQAFAAHAIGGEVPLTVQIRNDTTRIAKSVIAKSNYYAMSLYRELQRQLPEKTVLLSPHMIVWTKERGLYSRPILASEQIPSVLTIDFNVYSYPDTRKIMDSPPLTFGDIVTPLFVVHSSRWLQPSTHGLLLSSEPLLGVAWGQSQEQAQRQFENRLGRAGARVERPLDFITFLRNGVEPMADLPRKSVGESRLDVQAVEQYPVEKIRMDAELIANIATNYSVDPFAVDFVQGAATRVVRTLNSVDHDRATFFARQVALSRFDPELASAFLARSNDESVRARLQLAEALIQAERKFLAAQSVSIVEGTYEGDYGSKMRQLIEGEYRMLEERRRLARIQNVTTAVAAVALAGSVYGSTVSGAAGATALNSYFAGALVVGSLWAIGSAVDTKARSGQVTEHFMALIAPALDRQISVQTEWLESKEQITAMGFAEFRNKTLTLYQSRVRSMNAGISGPCVFSHPSIDIPGRWYGRCRDGLASDRGYGLIRSEGGRMIEFVGVAEGGMASGTGGMIVRNENEIGAVYYEGEFSSGLPDGVVRIEEPGMKPRVREFRAGVDVGKGNAAELKRLRF
jgi:hypothetical protein